MSSPSSHSLATLAILALADTKEAIEAFDRGDTNVFDALETIVSAVDRYRAAIGPESRREAA
jgi:hypothetical protein